MGAPMNFQRTDRMRSYTGVPTRHAPVAEVCPTSPVMLGDRRSRRVRAFFVRRELLCRLRPSERRQWVARRTLEQSDNPFNPHLPPRRRHFSQTGNDLRRDACASGFGRTRVRQSRSVRMAPALDPLLRRHQRRCHPTFQSVVLGDPRRRDHRRQSPWHSCQRGRSRDATATSASRTYRFTTLVAWRRRNSPASSTFRRKVGRPRSSTMSSWMARRCSTPSSGRASMSAARTEWFRRRTRTIIIRNSRASNIAGDGITIYACSKGLIENNVAYDVGCLPRRSGHAERYLDVGLRRLRRAVQ